MRAFALLLGAASLLVANEVRADESIIKNPGDHPDYHVEIEPHGDFGWANLYGGSGFGLGGRFTIPLVDNGFIKTINNNVGISFGVDWLRYSGCYYYDRRFNRDYGCGASYFLFPVAMQWNFWLSTHWSVFGEPGLYIYHGIYDDYCNGVAGCGYPTRTGVDFAFFAGGRYHFSEKVSLTMRIGYPYLSIGASFFL